MAVRTEILAGGEAGSVARASAVLRAGGLIGLPTETVYGLACDALSAPAVARVFAAKARPSFDPLIVHTRDLAHAQTLAEFDATARALAERFWPGPLTLVLPRRRAAGGKLAAESGGAFVVPDLVTAGLDRVALRVPDHAVAQAVLHESGLALAAPSANRFGSISPTTAAHVVNELDGHLKLVLDGGPCRAGVESTVVSVTGGAAGEPFVEVLRLGATSVEAIEAAVPGAAVRVARPTSDPRQRAVRPEKHNDTGMALPSPGMTDRHYAPRTTLRLGVPGDSPEAFARVEHGERWGLIGLGDVSRYADDFVATRSLSQTHDLAEAAARLFAVMRELDALGLEGIVALPVPDTGLGRAINDRLRRASTPA